MNMREKMQRAKHAGSITHYKGKRVGTYNPDSLPLERRALIEAQETLQKCGAGGMFNVYRQLSERYKSLVILLPVAMQTDVIIAKFLQYLELVKIVIVDDSKTKIYLLSWIYGIPVKRGHADVAQMFQNDAEQTLKDVREMLTYALHLIQQAQSQQRAEQNSEQFLNIIAGWERLKQSLSHPDMANEDIEAAKRSIPNAGADMLSVEPERLYNFITDKFARQIADSQGAYLEHQRWKRELLLSMGEDSADAGGGNAISL
jgi:hypothetical protein